MAIRKVTLYIQIRTSEGRRVRVKPVYITKGRLKPLYAWIDGVQEHHPEGVYVLRYGDKWEFVGQEPNAALTLRNSKKEDLEKTAEQPTPPTPITNSGPKMLTALDEYLDKKSTTDLETGREGLAPRSLSGIRTIVAAFQRTCGRVYMREVAKEDLLKYFALVRAQVRVGPQDKTYTEELRKKNVTVKNHWATLRAFFKYYRIDLVALLEPHQVPRAKGRKKEKYTRDEMARMWAAAKPEEKIRLQFFVASGFRRGEVAHLTWDDIDLWTGMACVTFKDGWKPKGRRARAVRLPDWLIALLRQRRAKRLRDTWVFPAKNGGPPRHHQLLYMLKAVAKRAGITGRIDLHKFRSTHASMLRDSGEVSTEEIQHRLGHADVATTRDYLAEFEQDTERAAEQVNNVFSKLA